MSRTFRVWVMASVALLMACSSSFIKPRSLYERLGGKGAIVAMVDDFMVRVMDDSRINGLFAQSNVDALKPRLVDQLCEAAGGPCTYTGASMKKAHQGRGIGDVQFDAFTGDFTKSLDRFRVPEREKAEVLAILTKLRTAVVK